VQVAERGWPPTAVHDSVQAVLRDPAFQRSLRRTLLDRMLLWLGDWWDRLVKAMHHLPSTRSIGLTIVALVVLFVVVRTIMSARARTEDVARQGRRRTTTTQDDPWQAAEALGSEGRFEEAAHALYRGVLVTIARTERIRLDPSRTSGDYSRELRRRGSASATHFRAFTRRFESAVYGHERCTADIIAELRALSEPFRPRARAA
jgi:heme exporter protein D